MSNALEKTTFARRIKSAFNLVIADSKRIKQDVFMIIIAALTVITIVGISGVFRLITFVMTYTNEGMPQESVDMSNQLYSVISYGLVMSYNMLGFFVIAAIALFAGRDFGYKTIRLKIFYGHSRTKIFFSSLAINLLIGIVFVVLSAVLSTAVNAVLFGVHFYDGAIFVRTLLSLLPYISTFAIATFVTFVTRSQIVSAIINLGIVYVIPQILLVLMMFVTNEVWINILGCIPYQTINELFINGLLTMDADLTGTGAIFPMPTLSLILRSTIAPVVIIAATVLGGLKVFKRADLN